VGRESAKRGHIWARKLLSAIPVLPQPVQPLKRGQLFLPSSGGLAAWRGRKRRLTEKNHGRRRDITAEERIFVYAEKLRSKEVYDPQERSSLKVEFEGKSLRQGLGKGTTYEGGGGVSIRTVRDSIFYLGKRIFPPFSCVNRGIRRRRENLLQQRKNSLRTPATWPSEGARS